MKERPLVSVVVVAYNNWPDLELAVQSALTQSYASVEAIVVDNSSEDATPTELRRLFGDRIRYIRQPNTGDAGAYNTGMSLAQGELVCFLDGDNLLTPYALKKQVNEFSEHPDADIVYGEVRKFRSDGGAPDWSDLSAPEEEDILAALLDPKSGIDSPSAMLYRRQALERVGPWDEDVYVTDIDYLLRAAALGLKFRRCPGLLGMIRQRPGQMSSDRAVMHRGAEKVLLKAQTYVDREPYRTMIKRSLARHRFAGALLRGDLSRTEALGLLRQARKASPTDVSLPAFLAAAAAVLVPGGRAAALSPRLAPLRRLAAGRAIPRF